MKILSVYRSVFLIIFLTISVLGNSQHISPKIPISNNTIDYKIIRTPTRFIDSNNLEISQTYIMVTLDDYDRDKLNNLKYEDWIKLLDNKRSDWAANLYLYDIYKKDALLFGTFRGRKGWMLCCREDDLNYWKKYLKTITR